MFDEAQWALTVDGRRVSVEAKPLAMLRHLLLHADKIVTKNELLDAVWPNVTVVEASLTTAMRKLRLALGNDQIIETVSGIGYRLAVPVELAASAKPPARRVDEPPAAWSTGTSTSFSGVRTERQVRTRPVLLWTGMAVATALLGLAFATSSPHGGASAKAEAALARDAATAVRELDVAAAERLIAAGWDPSRPWDKEGNDALAVLLNHCEWDRGHDRRKMLLMARTLVEGGAPIDRRNVFGDTAYSIAKAPRYCGPDHPVTQMLEAMCYGGSMGPKDLCLATYELTAEQRVAQGLPPKG